MSFFDYSEVVPGLYIGAHPEPEDPFDLGADVVVCLAAGSSVGVIPLDKLFVHWPIKDGPVPRPEVLRGLARLIATCLREHRAVFVHCQAGMNRSALLVGRVLIEQGYSGEEAVHLVGARRRNSLSDDYAEWLISEAGVSVSMKA
jgi:protein-tyrosine phosphatase